MTVTQMLRERIMENLKCLKEMKKDSPEYNQLVDDTMKMVDRYNTLVRANAENKSKKTDAKPAAKKPAAKKPDVNISRIYFLRNKPTIQNGEIRVLHGLFFFAP